MLCPNSMASDSSTADGVQERRPLGCALAMRVMQSDLYKELDDAERADCDELVQRNLEWFKRDNAHGVPLAAPTGMRQIGWVLQTSYGPLFEVNVTDEQRTRWHPVYVADGVPGTLEVEEKP